MYVVKRSFRSYGEMLPAGTVITEPAGIKHFKSRLSGGNIIEVTEQNFDSAKSYFKIKYGVDIEPTPKVETEPEKVQEPEKTLEPEKTPKPEGAKVVTKQAAKTK